ncbi:MAG: hypothetical protein ABJG88_08260 [Litorimonas sp.]
MKKGVIGLIITGLCVSACKVSVSTDVDLSGLKNPTPDMKDYAKATLGEFYDYDLDAVLNRVDPRVSDKFSLELLEQISDLTHETAQPQNAVKFGQSFKSEDGLKYVAIQYNVPNQIGREEVTLSLSYDKDICCRLVGYHAKIRLGDDYKMPEYEPVETAE